jgi:hypothetical protein
MTNPSLLIVPDRFKASKLYSQLPQDGSGDFVVTRATTAYRTNENGILESVASGVPRLDFPIGSGCPALLVEPAATNSIRNNSMQGAVTGTPGTLPTNWSEAVAGLTRQIVAVGTENGVDFIDIKLSGTATGASIVIAPETNASIVAASGQTWAHSAYIKIISSPAPPTSFALGFREALSDGTFVAFGSTAVTPTTTLTRFQATRALTGATTARVQPQLAITVVSGSTYDFTIRIGWPQIEQGSVATSPIRTTNATATRNADVINKTAVSGLIGQTEGTLYAEVGLINTPVTPFSRGIAIIDNGTLNRDNCVDIRQNSLGQVLAVVRVAGSNVFTTLTSAAVSGVCKIAFAYSATQCELYVNGIRVGTGAVPSSLPTSLSAIRLGYAFAAQGNFELNDRIRTAALYTTRLSNAQLQFLTTL